MSALRLSSNLRFNLVIEVLLISRETAFESARLAAVFQSRNRGSFDFKGDGTVGNPLGVNLFQSRNRGSFDFKGSIHCESRFTLIQFQSRNRGSFDFKR